MKIISKNALDFNLTAEMIALKDGIRHYKAEWEFGKIQIHSKQIQPLTLFHCVIEGKGEDELVVIVRQPAILLICSLHGKLEVRSKGLGDLCFHERGFNFIYAPMWSAEVQIRHDRQEILMIELPLSELYKREHQLPLFDTFMALVQLERPARMTKLNHVADRNILHKIGMAIQAKDNEEQLIWMYSIINSTLDRILHHPVKRAPRLTNDEIVKLYKVKDILMNELDTTYTLKDLSEKVDINILRLKKDFRKLFGLTPAALQTEQRMKKAAELLVTNRTYTILQVAESVGYKYHTDFTRAFKHFYGFAPKILSKKAPRY